MTKLGLHSMAATFEAEADRAALVDDLLGDGPLREGRIHGDRLAVEQHGLEQVTNDRSPAATQ